MLCCSMTEDSGRPERYGCISLEYLVLYLSNVLMCYKLKGKKKGKNPNS
jgi:hypothetical protein